MQLSMSDQCFINEIRTSNTDVSELVQMGKIKQAALRIASDIFEKPFKHVIKDQDIENIAGYINKRYPKAVPAMLKHLQKLQSVPHQVDMRCHSINTYARLYLLTGKTSYLNEISNELRAIPKILPDIPSHELPAMYPWHAGTEELAHHHFNYSLYELCNALPLLRNVLNDQEKLILLKMILAMADYCYRSTSEDVVFNHPLGNIMGVCMAACHLPQFKQSQQWLSWVQRKLLHDCIRYPTYSADGYSREGFSYQEVNSRHLIRCYTAMKYSGQAIHPKVKELCKNSSAIFQHILYNTGHYPLIGDCSARSLEESPIWHQAAAIFSMPELKCMNPVKQSDGCMERLAWDIGLDNLKWLDQQKRPALKDKQQKPYDLRASGFQIYGFGKGPQAHYGMLCYERSHNHAHHDCGSVNIAAFGKSLISDPGKNTYNPPYYDHECNAANHNLSCLIRRIPLGPRIDDQNYSKTIYVQHKKHYQAAAMKHTLYENHSYKRSLIGIPINKNTHKNSDIIWFVYDEITRNSPWPHGGKPLELIDSYFHFNAPESHLGIDRDQLTCWSKHSAKKSHLNIFGKDDVLLTGKSQRVRMKDRLGALHLKPSNGNLQITAIPRLTKTCRADLQEIASSTTEYMGRVKRPAINFQYRGALPFRCLFVLIPFNGLRQTAIAQVQGGFKGTNELHVDISMKGNRYHFYGKNLCSRKPEIRFR